MAVAVIFLPTVNQDFVILPIQMDQGFVAYLISFVAEITHAIWKNPAPLVLLTVVPAAQFAATALVNREKVVLPALWIVERVKNPMVRLALLLPSALVVIVFMALVVLRKLTAEIITVTVGV